MRTNEKRDVMRNNREEDSNKQPPDGQSTASWKGGRGRSIHFSDCRMSKFVLIFFDVVDKETRYSNLVVKSLCDNHR